ncbi:hypothetical protein C5749_04785 [Sphingobacterium gobiense]|uniref:Uncharacterized protein n=1 Tax=Sphingobacterium gobiense TaxID=1382456 RepID=A0A2S9JTF0_9SPHI|nr:hypothetical protein C5749_04785 [Sphingobacterium gobiense]
MDTRQKRIDNFLRVTFTIRYRIDYFLFTSPIVLDRIAKTSLPITIKSGMIDPPQNCIDYL